MSNKSNVFFFALSTCLLQSMTNQAGAAPQINAIDLQRCEEEIHRTELAIGYAKEAYVETADTDVKNFYYAVQDKIFDGNCFCDSSGDDLLLEEALGDTELMLDLWRSGLDSEILEGQSQNVIVYLQKNKEQIREIIRKTARSLGTLKRTQETCLTKLATEITDG